MKQGQKKKRNETNQKMKEEKRRRNEREKKDILSLLIYLKFYDRPPVRYTHEKQNNHKANP